MGGRTRIDVLGPLVVFRDGDPVDVGGPKSQAVLITLAHHLDKVVSVDTIFDALWADHPPKSARNVVQVKISGLRRAVGPSVEIRTEAAGYVLTSDNVSVDAVEFERHIESAESLLADDPAQAIEVCQEALGSWRGAPVAEDLDIRPLRSRVVALRDGRVRAQSMLLDARLRLRRHRDCCAGAEALADEHPFREDIRGLHMLALYRSGRQTEALAAFRRTRDLLVDELGVEPGPELRSLHRRILQHAPDLDPWNLPSEDVPTSEVTLSRNNLRSEPNTFVERPEIDRIIEALGPARVVTAVGTGGIGKSRCTAVVARRCLESGRFADGVWIVDLAPLPEDSDDVAVAVAAAMGLGSQPGTSIAETIVGYLHHRRALVVLDNCEHVASAVASFADAVVAGAPTTAMLAASRIRLGLRSEFVVTLGRLPDAAAQRLLVARIAESGAGPFTDDDCAELCAVLDNYPLAIELAAARTRTLAPREVAARLAEQPQLLGSSTDRPPGAGSRRYAGLSMALEWSLRHLSPRARDTLDRATVFASDFDLASAEAVLPSGETGVEEVVEDLGELVEHHVISRDHGLARFRVLEPIRQHLRVGSASSGQDRYVDHFAAFAVDAAVGLRGPDEAVWWDRIRADLPHVREAVRLAIDRADVALLESIMAQMAVTISICAFTEPGEWAVDALRRLELHPSQAPGIAAAAAAQFAHLDLVEECDAALEPVAARVDDAWMQAVVQCVRIFRDPTEPRWGELLEAPARECGDPAMFALARMRQVAPDMVDVADRHGNPTLRVFARQWRSASMPDKMTDASRRNKEELYRIALTSNNSHTIAEGQMFMALQHCFDGEPHRAGPLAAEMIERMVRIRSPHWVWHGVDAVASMLAMLKLEPLASETLWAAVSSSGRPPFSRVTRDPKLPLWVAAQLSAAGMRRAAAVGSAMDMDTAAREARKAAERMSAA